MKKFTFAKQLLAFLCLICAFSCTETITELPTSTAPEQITVEFNEQDYPTETVEQLFLHLSQQEGIQDMTMQKQYQVMQEYAMSEGLDFNLDHAIAAYETGMVVLGQELSVEDTFVQDQFILINDLVANYGLTQELLPALKTYKAELRLEMENASIGQEYYHVVLSMVYQTELMVSSPAMQQYIQNAYPDLMSPNTINRFNWACLWANLALAGAIGGCATGNALSCIGIAIAMANVIKYCGSSSVYVDPCADSPNPCCGVNCIQGYTCNSNGICVEDPYFDCLETGCPPNEQCLNNRCVPL